MMSLQKGVVLVREVTRRDAHDKRSGTGSRERRSSPIRLLVELLLLRAFYEVPSAQLATTGGAPRPQPLPAALPQPLPAAAPWRCSWSCSARWSLSSLGASGTLASHLRSAIRRTRARVAPNPGTAVCSRR